MFKGKKILALIPARGGSKGLPGKNIKVLLNKPLIAWTIEEARKSRYVDKIVVSTDSQEIAEISKKYGADTPFLRPKELATDEAQGIDVVLHAINWFRNVGEPYDLLILLQSTSPLRTPEDIDKAIELLFLKNAQAVISVSKVVHHPYWVNTLPDDGCMRDFIRQEAVNKNRQQVHDFYALNGAIYVAFCDYVLEKKGFHGDETFAYIMSKERSVDIDDEVDFFFAEFLMNKGRLK